MRTDEKVSLTRRRRQTKVCWSALADISLRGIYKIAFVNIQYFLIILFHRHNRLNHLVFQG